MNQEQILIKLLAGSLNFLRLARRGIEEKSPKIRGENISKVLAIMTELDCALDKDAGGEIADNLSNLYQHIIYRLVDANVKDDIKGIDEVEYILFNIKTGFDEAIKSNRQTQEAGASMPQPPEIKEQKGGMSLAV